MTTVAGLDKDSRSSAPGPGGGGGVLNPGHLTERLGLSLAPPQGLDARETMEALRRVIIHIARAQVACGALMIPLTWSWIVAALAIASGAIVLTYFPSRIKTEAYFHTRARMGAWSFAPGACGCEPVHLKGLNIANMVLACVHILAFIIAASTVGHYYIVTADAASDIGAAAGLSASAYGLISAYRYQAAMLVLGVLFSIGQLGLAAGLHLRYAQLEEAACSAFPPVPPAGLGPYGGLPAAQGVPPAALVYATGGPAPMPAAAPVAPMPAPAPLASPPGSYTASI